MIPAQDRRRSSAVELPDETEEERRLRQIELNKPLIALLRSWLDDNEESEEEQRAALEELKRGIDQHRLPGQKLFS